MQTVKLIDIQAKALLEIVNAKCRSLDECIQNNRDSFKKANDPKVKADIQARIDDYSERLTLWGETYQTLKDQIKLNGGAK